MSFSVVRTAPYFVDDDGERITNFDLVKSFRVETTINDKVYISLCAFDFASDDFIFYNQEDLENEELIFEKVSIPGYTTIEDVEKKFFEKVYGGGEGASTIVEVSYGYELFFPKNNCKEG